MEEYEVHIEVYKGRPVLCIPTGGGYFLKIGLKKARAILDYIQEINNFVESNGKTIGGQNDSRRDKKSS